MECPLTSAVSVAMMIRHVAPRAVGREFYTPTWAKSRTWIVTTEARNPISICTVNHQQNGIEPDLVLDINGYKIAVELKYTGRAGGKFARHSSADYGAVLYLDCDQFDSQTLWTDSSMRFSDAALEFLLGEVGKKWRQHPKEKLGHPTKCSNHL